MSERVRGWWRVLRGEERRLRKLRQLLALLRPYRGRLILMLIALVVATGAALVPPYLAGRAIDDGIRAGDVDALTVITIACLTAFMLRAASATGAYARVAGMFS